MSKSTALLALGFLEASKEPTKSVSAVERGIPEELLESNTLAKTLDELARVQAQLKNVQAAQERRIKALEDIARKQEAL